EQLATLGQAEDLGQGAIGLEAFEPLYGPGAEDQHAMRTLAAQRLLPGEGDDIELGEIEVLREGSRSGVADGEALAVGRDPVAIGDADTRCGAVPGEDHVAVEIDLAEIGQ